MTRALRVAGLLAAGLGPLAPAAAVDLEALSVTASGTDRRLAESPVVTEILSAQNLQESGASTLGEALSAYGLVVSDDASHGTPITLQGLGGQRVLILVDGRRVAGRVAQNVEAGDLSLDNVERIEIIRGPQSALYGSDAVGGVINLISRAPDRRASAELRAENRSAAAYNDPDTVRGVRRDPDAFLSQRGSLSVNLPWEGGAATATAEGYRSDFYWDEAGEVSILPSSLRGRLGLDAEAAAGAGGLVRAGASAFAVREDSQTDFTGSLARRELVRAEGYGSWRAVVAEGSLEGKASTQWYHRRAASQVGGSEAWTEDSLAQESLSAISLRYLRDWGGSHTLTFGLEATLEADQKDVIADGTWMSADQEAWVLQDEWSDDAGAAVTTGLRLDRGSRFGWFAAPKVSAMVFMAPGLRVLGGLGAGYRTPTTEELYYDIDWSWHPIVRGNPDLRPETSLAANLGVEAAPGTGWSARLNAFHQELQDEIVYREVGTAADGRTIHQSANQNRTSRTGVDTEASVSWNDLVGLEAAYSRVFAWNRTEQTVVADVPSDQVRAALTLRWRPWGLTGRTSLQWDSLRNVPVWGASFTAAGPRWDLSVRAENLTGAVHPGDGPFVPLSVTTEVRLRTDSWKL